MHGLALGSTVEISAHYNANLTAVMELFAFLVCLRNASDGGTVSRHGRSDLLRRGLECLCDGGYRGAACACWRCRAATGAASDSELVCHRRVRRTFSG